MLDAYFTKASHSRSTRCISAKRREIFPSNVGKRAVKSDCSELLIEMQLVLLSLKGFRHSLIRDDGYDVGIWLQKSICVCETGVNKTGSTISVRL